MPFFPFYILSTYARLDNRRVLMLVLILRNYNTPEIRTFEEWSAILNLSTRWGFTSFRDLAIRCIKPPNPLDRLILARKYAVEEWTLPALLGLCERPDSLSLEEARLMDFEDVVLVGSVRQTVRPSMLTVDGTGIGNYVRAWKSGTPSSSPTDAKEPIGSSPKKRGEFHIATFYMHLTLVYTAWIWGQPAPSPIDNEEVPDPPNNPLQIRVDAQPTCASKDEDWGPVRGTASGRVTINLKKKRSKNGNKGP
jgi:hypothetical protein